MPLTYVVFLLDRTGSMARLKPTHIEGFNTYLSSLKDKRNSKDIIFTLIQFHGRGAETIYQRVPVQDAEPLSEARFQPKGRTPLIDATCKTIQAIARAVDADPAVAPQTSAWAPGRASNIVVCIQSDGDDNASVEYGWAELQQLVLEKQALGWQMIFLGANIDPEEQADWMGLPADSMMPYSPDLEATRRVFARAAEKTSNGVAERGVISAPKKDDGIQDEEQSPVRRTAGQGPQKIPDDLAV